MELQTLDTTTYYLFLILGVVLILAGLTLIVRKRTDENAARIEMFGLKFQASSAGTLVMLIGVGLLVVPLVVPRGTDVSDAETPKAVGSVPQKPPSSNNLALMLPQTADAEEVEPNDAISAANQFSYGFGVKGRIDRERDDLSDWFVVDTTEAIGKDINVQIRSTWGGCHLHAFDQDEEKLGSVYCNQSGGSGNFAFFNKDNARIYLRIVFSGGSAAKQSEYEVFLAAK